MKDESRRSILSKLGAGAALLVTGDALASTAGKVINRAPTLDPTRVIPVIAPDRQFAIKVIGTSEGLHVIDPVATEKFGELGIQKDGKAIQLGVVIHDRGVSIQGLDGVLDRAASEGRCHYSALAAAGAVINPGDPYDLVVRELKPEQLLSF